MRVALNGLFLAAPATGTGQYLRELVRAMREIVPENEFTLIAPRPDSSVPAPLRVESTRFKSDNLAKLEFEQYTFPRACARQKFSLAHIPHFGPPLLPTIPTVVTIHDLIPMVLPAYRGSFAVQVYTRLAAIGARRARAIFADSHASAHDIETHLHIPPERIRVVHLAADARFRKITDPAEIARVREKYSLPERFVLYLGGFDVRKNVVRIIEAYTGLDTERHAGWKLVLAGQLANTSSNFFPNPRVIAEEHRVADDVQCIGFVAEQDKPALYSVARVFVYPSLYEGFGLPPLEAMACGTPVISANTASLPEVVGNAGILLAPVDTAAWAAALRVILKDDDRYNELSGLGARQAKQFSWERAARETLQVYREVCYNPQGVNYEHS